MGSAALRQRPSTERRGRTSSLENSGALPTRPKEDEARTLRNLVPWRNMEKELAKRLAAKAARGELDDKVALPIGDRASEPSVRPMFQAPDSGVRTAMRASEEQGPLSYSVYTVSELQARNIRAQRTSLVPAAAPETSAWANVWSTALALVRAWSIARRAPMPRPPVADACRLPLATFKAELRAALGALPYRRIALGFVGAFAATALFLVAVMTVADLTDDLKPVRGAASSTLVAPPLPVVADEPAIVPPAEAVIEVGSAPEAEPPAIELDDDVAPATAGAKAKTKPAAKPIVRSKAKKPASHVAEPTSI